MESDWRLGQRAGVLSRHVLKDSRSKFSLVSSLIETNKCQSISSSSAQEAGTWTGGFRESRLDKFGSSVSPTFTIQTMNQPIVPTRRDEGRAVRQGSHW